MESQEISFDNRTIEQKFAYIQFSNQVNQMSLAQAQQMLIYMYKMNTIKENSYQSMLKNSWFGDLIRE
jgi:hypothetical protein